MSNIRDLKSIDLATWRAMHKQFPEPPSAVIDVGQWRAEHNGQWPHISVENGSVQLSKHNTIERISIAVERMDKLLKVHQKALADLYMHQNIIMGARIKQLEQEAEDERAKYKKEKL